MPNNTRHARALMNQMNSLSRWQLVEKLHSTNLLCSTVVCAHCIPPRHMTCIKSTRSIDGYVWLVLPFIIMHECGSLENLVFLPVFWGGPKIKWVWGINKFESDAESLEVNLVKWAVINIAKYRSGFLSGGIAEFLGVIAFLHSPG